MSFLAGADWWTATQAAYALHQDQPVTIKGNAVKFNGRLHLACDPRGVVSEARRMAGK